MAAGGPKDVNDLFPMALGTDIPHTRRNAPRIEPELSGTRGTQSIKELIDFCRIHRSILSFRHCRKVSLIH
jgi:hypothetical protein